MVSLNIKSLWDWQDEYAGTLSIDNDYIVCRSYIAAQWSWADSMEKPSCVRSIGFQHPAQVESNSDFYPQIILLFIRLPLLLCLFLPPPHTHAQYISAQLNHVNFPECSICIYIFFTSKHLQMLLLWLLLIIIMTVVVTMITINYWVLSSLLTFSYWVLLFSHLRNRKLGLRVFDEPEQISD